VRGNLARFFSGNTVAAFTLVPDELETYGDVAYERGTFTWVGGSKGQLSPARQARYSLVRRRGRDGVWRIHRYIENSPAPVPR
jgi:ketosteroid isomerase-like protein